VTAPLMKGTTQVEKKPKSCHHKKTLGIIRTKSGKGEKINAKLFGNTLF